MDNSTVGGYGLRNRQGRNYNHRYAGEEFAVGDDTGITLTTRGSDEFFETPQMSLKTGFLNLRGRLYEGSGKGDASAP